jgi:hypothetical protein
VLREEKVSTHIHDFVLSPDGDTITLVGHNKVVLYKIG